MSLYDYDAWPSRAGQGWVNGTQPSDNEWGRTDFHVDLGSGTVPKGRIGVDHFAHPSVAVVAELGGEHGARTFATPAAPGQQATVNTNILDQKGLPFETSSIKSIVSHHALEHVGEGFIELIDEAWRVLEQGGLFYVVVPLYPSTSAVEDVDHVRYFMEGSWGAFYGKPGEPHWHESFSVPYAKARFALLDLDCTALFPPELRWTAEDRREMRVALRAEK